MTVSDEAAPVNVPPIGYGGRPVIYVAPLVASMYGPGRALSIMSATRHPSMSRVPAARASDGAVHRLRTGALGFERFKGRYCRIMEQRVASGLCAPGALMCISAPDWAPASVEPGDTLVCGCGSDDGRCHRSWLAPYLVAAGWRVVLDGRDLL